MAHGDVKNGAGAQNDEMPMLLSRAMVFPSPLRQPVPLETTDKEQPINWEYLKDKVDSESISVSEAPRTRSAFSRAH
jgi:hypothetical protein